MTEGTPLWKLATKLIGKIVCKTEPPQSYFDCHKPKPVLLPTGCKLIGLFDDGLNITDMNA